MIQVFILNMVILQLVGILGFVWIGSILPHPWWKILIIIIFVVGTAIITLKFFSNYKMKNAVVVSATCAFCFVLIYQAIGFNFYSGIVKDLSIFSSQHLRVSGIVFAVTFLFYNFCYSLLALKSRI